MATWVRVLRRTIVRGEARDPGWEGWCPEGDLDVLLDAGYVEEADEPGEEPEPEAEPEATPADTEPVSTEAAATEPEAEASDEDEEAADTAEAPEDEGEAEGDDADLEPEPDVPDWSLTMPEAEYLNRFPDGQHAEAARARIEAGVAEDDEDES